MTHVHHLHAWQVTGAWLAFLTTYLALAVGEVPWFKLDRTGAAFVGAVLMVSLGVIDPHEAFLGQDYHTLALLFSMMLIVSFLANSGLLDRFEHWLLGRLTTGRGLLWAVVLGTGTLSACFINDVVVLVMTPLVVAAAARMGLNPLPYVLATAMASNLGSVATPVGNPQNIYLAASSGIPYSHFVLRLAPVAAGGLLFLGLYLEWAFRGQWEGPRHEATVPEPPPVRTYVLVRTLVVLIALLLGFWSGLEPSTVAAACAAVLLLTRRVPRAKIFGLVDWDLLVLFVSLFTLMAGTRAAGIIATIYQHLSFLRLDATLPLAAVTVVLSNLCSNVPAVLFLTHLVPEGNPDRFLLMAMVSTLAGNLTLIGSIANVIVAEKARPEVELSFWTYLRHGVPVTLGTLALGLLYWGW